MITVEQALEKVLNHVNTLEGEQVPILDSLGQVLAEDINSDIDIPPLDNSAMDGYAVQSRDTRGSSMESPRFLQVIDTVIAGSISKQDVKPGTAIRIMTGAPVPKGADAVVKFEDTDEEQRKQPSANQPAATEIGIFYEAKIGLNIRLAGEDISRGTAIFRKGITIRPSEVGVLASLGRSEVRCIRRPIVAILATGNELVNIDQPLPAGKIYNSNTYSVAALVKRYGGIPKILGIALDNEDSLVTKLHQGRYADMLITTGGVSAGDYDIVKDILAKKGDITFWTVQMKPGKPIAFGIIRKIGQTGTTGVMPHLGLPGNPVSSMVTFELFARPSILKMMGKTNFTKPTIEAILEDSIVNTDAKRLFIRAVIEKRNGQCFARLTGPQGSGILTSMSLANGLVIVPEDKAKANKGEVVQVMMLDWNEEVNI
ncbi:gephyrin-like molybdotransferase Glp [Chloroflexota bacterium]